MAALRCRFLPEGAALELTVRHMWLHLIAVACSRRRTPVSFVVLGEVLLRLASLYPALGVCMCFGGGRLYHVAVDRALYIKRGESLFR